MSTPTPVLPGCCPPACPSPLLTPVPGPAGENGDPGIAGVNGFDSFTYTTLPFVVPATNANVTTFVGNSLWAIIGQIVFIQFAGYYQVISRPDSTTLVVKNLGYTGNAATGVTIPSASQMGPAGLKGLDGVSPSTLNGISPTTGKGQILVDNGANTPSASLVALSPGTNGTRLKANSAAATGLEWAKVDLSAAAEITTGAATGVARADGAGALVFTDTLTSALTINNLLTIDRIAYTQETVAYAATTNINFNGKAHQTVSLTGDVTFTTSNLAAGKVVLVRIISDASIRAFTFPAGWVFVGAAAPANIAASKTAFLYLTSFGAADADVRAEYFVQA